MSELSDRDRRLLTCLWACSHPQTEDGPLPVQWCSADLIERHGRAHYALDMTVTGVGRALSRLAREGHCEKGGAFGAGTYRRLEPVE